MNARDFAAQLQQRKQKNLAFFERYFSNIYHSFKDKELENAQLNLDPNTLEVNLVENGKAIYPLEAAEFNKNEAQQFSDAFKVGGMNHPISRAKPSDFYRGRFAHGSIANFLEAVDSTAEAIKPYTFRDCIPQVVFLGSGLGTHITEFLKIRDVRHGILVEHNPDRFLASLYVTDWEELILPYIKDQTRSFVLSVGDTRSLNKDERIHQAFAGAWNSMCMNVPFMPIQTVYYVHQADSFYDEVANRLNDEIEPYINVWGYYDDEVNQLNHVFHNIEQGIPILKKVDLSANSKATIICGNGPSLDTYLPIIKEHRQKLNVIAAGSATHSLLKNDIYPDFMVTLESDYATYQALTMLPADKTKQISIVGAAQITPATFGLFAESLMYLKDETTYARLFDRNNDTIADGTPSASNAALAVTLDLKPSKVFLIGMDFGFLDPSKTHSDSSFYAEKNKQHEFEAFKKRITAETYKVQTNKRGDVYTTPFYNTARIHAERKIRVSQRKDIINLSLGATIEGTVEQTLKEFTHYIEKLSVNPSERPIFDILKAQATKLSKKDLTRANKEVEQAFNKLKIENLAIIEKLEPNLGSIEVAVFKLNQTITNSKDSGVQKTNMFMRGIVWHWITNYYALCKEYGAEEKLERFTQEFKQHFGGFMSYLPEHFLSYVSQRTKDDPKLVLSIADAEPNIEEWFKKVESFKFQPKKIKANSKSATK